MFIPIGDAPNPVGFKPWVNWALIAANVLVFVLIAIPLGGTPADPTDPLVLEYARSIAERVPGHSLREILAQISAYDLFVLDHGFKPGKPSIADLFASLFLHGGFAHLAGNMLFLWIYGDNVEHRLGRIPYLLVYLLTGVVATVSFAAFNLDSVTPLVGASGAISGVLGLYFVMFPRNKVKMFVALFPFFFNTIMLPARWVLGAYLILDNFLPVLLGSASSVAFGAHIGGFGSGLVIAWIWERASLRLPRKQAARSVPASHFAGSDDDLARAIRARDRSTAIRLAGEVPLGQLATLSVSDTIRLAEWLAKAGQPVFAGDLMRRVLGAGRVSPEDQARVYLTLGLIRLQQGQVASAYQHLHSAIDSSPDADTEEEARRALAGIRLR